MSEAELMQKIIEEFERTIPQNWMTAKLQNLLTAYHKNKTEV